MPTESSLLFYFARLHASWLRRDGESLSSLVTKGTADFMHVEVKAWPGAKSSTGQSLFRREMETMTQDALVVTYYYYVPSELDSWSTFIGCLKKRIPCGVSGYSLN